MSDEQDYDAMIRTLKSICDCEDCNKKRHDLSQALIDNMIDTLKSGNPFQREKA